MIRTLSRFLPTGLMLIFAFSLVGCGGSGGQSEPVEQLVRQTFSEDCLLCHRTGSIRDVAEVHSIETNSPVVSIIAVREVDLGGGDVRLEVDVKIVDSANPLIPVYIDPTDTGPTGQVRNLRFTLTKLVPGIGADINWQSYINSAGAPLGATYERANVGVFSALPTPGEYRYRFSFNMNAVKDPVSGVDISYDKANTHRIATQWPDNVNNAFVDFVPNSLPLASPFPVPAVNRKISANASCNQCHVRLGFHGGDRKSVEYCVTCHNPGSTDPTSGNTVDFKVMIHKIHRGEDLPGPDYTLGNADYSTVVYPQDIRNCTKCHDGADAATTEGDNWKTVPTREACGSCHDNVDFATGANHDGGIQTDNQCIFCHPPSGGVAGVVDGHGIPAQVAAASMELNILDVSTAAGTAGALDVTIQFSVTDPTNADLAYDITDKTTVDLTPLSFLIGWDTTDYSNTNSGSTPAQPLGAGVSSATDTGNNIYTLTVTDAVPAGITGSGVVGFQGHPYTDQDGDGDVDDRVPVKSVVKSFAITDATAVDRRTVVSIAKCNNCHGSLSLHGSNRTDEIQICVICHNADATDVSVRPVDATTATDGKAEEAIDFKYMIHAIHAGDKDVHGFRENGIVVYGRGTTEYDFSHVRFPGILQNCEACHVSGAFELPLNANILPTTVNVGNDPEDPDDDREITPVASVCSSCHDSIFSRTHMAENGGNFDFMLFEAEAEGEGSGSGGPSGEQPPGHTTRTDCTTCHGAQ